MSDEIDGIIKSIHNESDIENTDKEILDFLKSMLDSDNIELKTHIPKKELEKLILLDLYAENVKKYSEKTHALIKQYLNIKFRFSLSTDRASRTEMINAIKSLKNNYVNEINAEENTKKRFLR